MGEAIMQSRKFGRTGRRVGEIGFGAWAIGGSWGEVEEADAVAALNAALDAGVTFIDTADVYGDGRSERLVAKVLKARPNADVFVATKAGRRLPQQTVAGYSYDNLSGWIERSLKNLEVETLDLVQLHCPPTDLYYHPEAFDALDRLKAAGKIRDYGVSVERIEEALKAIEYPGVVSVQIIFNIFRQRPAGLFFEVGEGAGDRGDRARAAGERPAHRQAQGRFRLSRIATTENSTGTARRSMSAKPSPACPMRSGSRRSSASGRWSGATRPWRNSPCAGS